MTQRDQIAEVAVDYRTATARLHRLRDLHDIGAWRRRPGPGAWSANECIAHLNLSAERYLVPLRAAVEEAGAGSPSHRTWRIGLFGRLFRALVGPLPRLLGKRRFGVATPEDFNPGEALDRDQVIAGFERANRELLAILESSEGRAMDRPKFPSPFDERVRVTPWLALVILARHEHRHLDQAEEALRAAEGTEGLSRRSTVDDVQGTRSP